MPDPQSIVAALVAVAAGYSVVRTIRSMTAYGHDVSNGGAWAVLLLLEVAVSLVAAAVAVS